MSGSPRKPAGSADNASQPSRAASVTEMEPDYLRRYALWALAALYAPQHESLPESFVLYGTPGAACIRVSHVLAARAALVIENERRQEEKDG